MPSRTTLLLCSPPNAANRSVQVRPRPAAPVAHKSCCEQTHRASFRRPARTILNNLLARKAHSLHELAFPTTPPKPASLHARSHTAARPGREFGQQHAGFVCACDTPILASDLARYSQRNLIASSLCLSPSKQPQFLLRPTQKQQTVSTRSAPDEGTQRRHGIASLGSTRMLGRCDPTLGFSGSAFLLYIPEC